MAVSSQRATIPTKRCTVDEVLEPTVARRLREDMDARNRRARGAVVVLAKRRSWERRVAVGLTISLTLCRIESGGSLVRNWELQANSGRSVLQLGRFSSDEGYPSVPLCSPSCTCQTCTQTLLLVSQSLLFLCSPMFRKAARPRISAPSSRGSIA
jgi:hypothetical protein